MKNWSLEADRIGPAGEEEDDEEEGQTADRLASSSSEETRGSGWFDEGEDD